ncbi:MAG: HAMP domain-containing sensor histidine kinase [Candidatus Pacebacteria bacterium]|nr:HAMP domain-containing sensor histidine kinase [Candidatus Paceibacterota bacterium]
MFEKRSIASHINPLYSCRRYGVSLWQCPQFLFLVMGLFSIIAIIAVWLVATSRISDPFLVVLIVLASGAFLIVMSFVITNSFERMAEASKMKTEFIGIISHQLRTPLTNLKFSLDFLLSDHFAQERSQQLEYFGILQENTKRMGDLVDSLLTISRLENNNVPLEKKDVSLERVASDIIAKDKPFADASGMRIILDCKPGLENVSADLLWLEQIVGNLLDNAIRYSKGGGQIDINIRRKGKMVLFSIKDQGVGIPKAEQKFIFEKFFRSTNARKKQVDGSGLGLYIVKRFVELLGGKIWFKSIEGKGTAFYFTLPVAR